MADIDVDVAVLGWGNGGKTLAGALGRAGKSVAVVERSSQMHGGSCININCVPTKALIHQGESRPDGVDAGDWFTASVGRRDSLVAKLRARNHAMLAVVDAVTLVEGHARFVGPHQVEVQAGADRLLIEAETVVVNTGSLPATPSIEGAAESAVHDSTTLQQVDPLPRRLVIVGAGYVGLEFAGMFAHFGSEVTLVDHHDERQRWPAVHICLPRRLSHRPRPAHRCRHARDDRPGRSALHNVPHPTAGPGGPQRDPGA